MNELEEGRAVNKVWMKRHDPASEQLIFHVGYAKLGGPGGHSTVASISVRMQPGQMALVPWVLVRFREGPPRLLNISDISQIEFTVGREEIPGDLDE